MDDTKPIIAVVGATGLQGGSVANALLDTGRFTVRALTRTLDSDAALALADRGAQVVQADVYRPDDLNAALAGAYGVFFTTFSDFPSKQPGLEVCQGKNVADAAQRAGVKHVVFSTLPDLRQLSSGKYSHVHHFNEKAEVAAYIKSLGLPATFMVYGYYMTNVTASPFAYRKVAVGDTEEYEFLVPVPVSSVTAVADTVGDGGRCVAHCLMNREETVGQEYFVATEFLTYEEMARELAQATGKVIRAVQLSPEEISQHPVFRTDEARDMFNFFHEFGYPAELNLDKTANTFGKLTTFREFLKREKHVALPQ
ncbi:hypothetical protein IWQ60_001062 [Tieghemiomyces parasiticus]|uniref:NmrA-like domain-containing protein n=1 Tax=Tieghemiomyces parasiticus TaxID=78921 RepID=A0A9W8DYM9_9FUNG|nr:hypothetical protein IWQ60_001062 [Tieghemiomyces parasiticus]